MKKQEEARIFLSYTNKDRAKVKALYQKLKGAGYHPWMDIKDILPGEDWHKVIMEAIRDAKFFLACLSPRSIDHRGVVQEEIKEALQEWRCKLDNDIYIIPVRLEECKIPDALTEFHRFDFFEATGFSSLLQAIREGMVRQELIQPVRLRSESRYAFTEDNAMAMLRRFDFYDYEMNRTGKGLHHRYVSIVHEGRKLVIDHTTGLTWQQSGSQQPIKYPETQKYIQEIRYEKFGGFDDWRLPTLEEAMSLLEPERKNDNLYIDPVFDNKQFYIWTADGKFSGRRQWNVSLSSGCCTTYNSYLSTGYVRAVRHSSYGK